MKIVIKKLPVYAFILIALVLFLIIYLITNSLYGVVIERERKVLLNMVSSNASLMNAIAKFDRASQQFEHPERATLAQIHEFISSYDLRSGAKEIFVFKEVENGYLVVSSTEKKNINKVITKDNAVFNMIQKALDKKLGVFEQKNDEGVDEMIGFSLISELHYGFVAKIDLTEIWGPYKNRVNTFLFICMVVCVFFVLLLIRSLRPIIEQLQGEHNRAVEALEDLKENEERLEIALSVNNDGVFDWNTVSNEVYFDARYYTMAGYEPNEFPGRLDEWSCRVHPDDMPKTSKAIQDYLVGNLKEYDVEFRFRKKDNSWMWIRARIKVFGVNENGEALRAIGTHTDITALKNAEIELKEREEKFRTFFELGMVGMAIISLENRWLEFNETLSTMLGCSEEEFKSKKWSDFTYPEDMQKDEENFKKTLSGEINGYSMEKRFIRKDGEILYAVISVLAVRDANADIKYFVALVHDITGLKLTELKLRKNEENLRVTLNSIGDAVISTDMNGCIARMNKVAESLTGWKFADAVGKKLQEVFNVVHSITREPIEDPMEKFLAMEESISVSNQSILISRDGNEYQIAESGAPILSEDNNPIGVVLVFRDVTEDYVVQDQLRHSQKMDAIGQLAGGVAHDFNNMLGGILMAASILKRFVPEIPKAKNAHKVIIESANHAASLTQKLLTFARKQHTRMKAVDLHVIINDTVALLRDTVDRRIQIRLDLLAKSSVVIGDASQLQSAILNLGINASHAMSKGGLLVIRTELIDLSEKDVKKSLFNLKAGSYIQIEVEDTGIGMSKDILGRIFEPFFTTKDVGKGTGLGLAAVYGTIQQQGGGISVESIEGQGSVFSICLSLSAEHIEQSKNQEEVPVGSGVVLIVDDEKVMRDTMVDILETYGYEVLVAENGIKGLQIFKTLHSTIDLVILDMIMPEMGGLDCLVEMKKIDENVRVILSSGYTDDESFSAMQSEGVVEFLRKPFQGEDLGRAVYSALNKK